MIDLSFTALSAADAVAHAHAEIGRSLTAGPGIWTRRLPGISAHVSGMPFAGCNGLYVYGGDADATSLRELIEEVAAFDVPFTVKIRSGFDRLAGTLPAGGLEWHEDLPLMAVDAAAFRPAARPPELCLRVLDAAEERFHMDLVAEGLGMPRAALDLVMSAANQALPCWSTYVGEVDGRLAVTGSAIAGAGHAALIAIATDDAFRRRGYAAALTSAAVADALAAGAERVFLHSSPMGMRVYQALGFRTLEELQVWVKA
jgi:ribosomal protein S18 acetylase RimI-like enzyme